MLGFKPCYSSIFTGRSFHVHLSYFLSYEDWFNALLSIYGQSRLFYIQYSYLCVCLRPAFHPMQISTPMPGQQQQQAMAAALNNTSFANVTHQHNNNTTAADGNAEPTFSPLHNALYLYLARILRPVWSIQLLKQETTPQGTKQVITGLVI